MMTEISGRVLSEKSGLLVMYAALHSSGNPISHGGRARSQPSFESIRLYPEGARTIPVMQLNRCRQTRDKLVHRRAVSFPIPIVIDYNDSVLCNSGVEYFKADFGRVVPVSIESQK